MTNRHHPPSPEHDASLLFLEVIRLSAELATVRLTSANRLAAIRATLAASAEGEADPLAYLRDQLADEAASGSGSGL